MELQKEQLDLHSLRWHQSPLWPPVREPQFFETAQENQYGHLKNSVEWKQKIIERQESTIADLRETISSQYEKIRVLEDYISNKFDHPVLVEGLHKATINNPISNLILNDSNKSNESIDLISQPIAEEKENLTSPLLAPKDLLGINMPYIFVENGKNKTILSNESMQNQHTEFALQHDQKSDTKSDLNQRINSMLQNLKLKYAKREIKIKDDNNEFEKESATNSMNTTLVHLNKFRPKPMRLLRLEVKAETFIHQISVNEKYITPVDLEACVIDSKSRANLSLRVDTNRKSPLVIAESLTNTKRLNPTPQKRPPKLRLIPPTPVKEQPERNIEGEHLLQSERNISINSNIPETNVSSTSTIPQTSPKCPEFSNDESISTINLSKVTQQESPMEVNFKSKLDSIQELIILNCSKHASRMSQLNEGYCELVNLLEKDVKCKFTREAVNVLNL
jgi:hypothetical protein